MNARFTTAKLALAAATPSASVPATASEYNR